MDLNADKAAELIASYGSYNSTDNWLSFGDHTEKFAYYASFSGNSTQWGLEPPVLENQHNDAMGGGAFTSLLYNPSEKDQLRFAGGLRLDYYQVPNDPEQTTVGFDDRQREQDIFATGTWVHTFNPSLLFVLSPFYHFNRAVYQGGPTNQPEAANNRGSNYEGGQTTISWINKREQYSRRSLRLCPAGQFVFFNLRQRWLGGFLQPAREAHRKPGSSLP